MTSDAGHNFKFGNQLEAYLAGAFVALQKTGKIAAAELLREAVPTLEVGTGYDNWDGGQHFHTLRLQVPLERYAELGSEISGLENDIKDNVNFVSTDLKNESLESVSIVPLLSDTVNWRIEGRHVPQDRNDAIWGTGKYRAFISHLSEKKETATELKKQLKAFGVSCFVAHEDIEPTKAWQDELEDALMSMDCLIALLTEGFHESNWTDQEIGFACARGVKVIPVMQGMVPYGFIGKFQAVKFRPDTIAWEVFKQMPMFRNEADAFVNAVRNASSYDDAVSISKVFHQLKPLTEPQVMEILSIAKKNTWIRDSTTFGRRTKHSQGFHHYMYEWIGADYQYNFEDGEFHRK